MSHTQPPPHIICIKARNLFGSAYMSLLLLFIKNKNIKASYDGTKDTTAHYRKSLLCEKDNGTVNIYRQKYKRNMYGTCHLNENVLLLLFSDVWC